jgi:hypothetical protein
MDATQAARKPLEALTGQELLPYAQLMLDYTDTLLGELPTDEAELDWRPADSAGGWYFSLREQALHIVDFRFIVLGWITGDSFMNKTYFTEHGGADEPWQFKPSTHENIVASGKAGRAELDAMLVRPVPELLAPSPALEEQFAAGLQRMRAQGDDTGALEARGPRRAIDLIVFLLAHEQGHRALLQFQLRQRGHRVTRAM